MPNATPLISVLMPVYNAERYLSMAIDSVLSQTLGDFEFIIINDGSTDGSEAMLRRYANEDKRIRLISRPNTGYVVALNEALSIASGELIARMDADDICFPRRFERQADFLRSHPEVLVVGGRVEIIDARGRLIVRPDVPLDDESLQRELLQGRNLVGHPSVMVRRKPMTDCGGYNVESSPTEDLDLWLRMGEIGKLANVPQFILRYRQHDQSVSVKQSDRQIASARAACERAWKRRGIVAKFNEDTSSRTIKSRQSRLDYQVRFGWWAFNSAQRGTAIRYAIRAIALNPFQQPGWKLLACCLIKPLPILAAVEQ